MLKTKLHCIFDVICIRQDPLYILLLSLRTKTSKLENSVSGLTQRITYTAVYNTG